MADLEDLNPQFLASLQALIKASGGKISVVSGYRTPEHQAQLYAAAVKKYGAANARKYVAPPGHSNHNKGLAVDLGGDLALAHQLAPQFGLYFPMSWEAWHVEPVGTRGNSSHLAYTTGPQGSPAADVAPNKDPREAAANAMGNLLSILTGDTPAAGAVQETTVGT